MARLPERSARPRSLMFAALFVIYFVWGSTFLAGRVTVEYLPPFTIAAIRSLAAGGLLYAIAAYRGLRPMRWRSAILTGVPMFVGGHGLLLKGMQTVASGSAAVIDATIPLWVLLFTWLADRKIKPSAWGLAGTAFGLAGVALLAVPWQQTGDGVDVAGAAAVLVGAIAWAGASVGARSRLTPGGSIQAAAMQLLAGGVACAAVARVLGEVPSRSVASWSLEPVAALAYLIVGGSALGVLSYLWLLSRVDAYKVASYAFVNPLVAVAIGWLLAGETLTPRVVLASAVTLVGVVIVVGARAPADTTPRSSRVKGASHDCPHLARSSSH